MAQGKNDMAARRLRISGNERLAEEETVAALAAGQMVVFPTETVYGIGVAQGLPAALENLRRLKGREAAKPFQLLVPDVETAEAMGGVFCESARRLAAAYWPGAMTMVVPARQGGNTFGFRIPDSEFLLAVLERLGRALVSSSANRAGERSPTTAEAADAFGDEVALVLDGGPCSVGTASTVVSAVDPDNFSILREGAISADAIAKVWNRGCDA